MMKDQADFYNNYIQSLFSVLYEVYNSSAGPAVKHRCLQSLLRMIYFCPSDLLENILKQQSVSSQIASMLASSDPKIVVSALQIAEILMRKLPQIFSICFYREGVIHQIEVLIGFGVSLARLDVEESTPTDEATSTSVRPPARRHYTTSESYPATTRIETRSQRARGLADSSRTRPPILFRQASTFDPRATPIYVPSPFTSGSQERNKLKEWIQHQAGLFRQTYFVHQSNNALEIIHRLASAVELLHVTKTSAENAQALRDIAHIIANGDVSPFEMVHSGLISKLYQYLTDDLSTPHDRPQRLKQFLTIFSQLPINEDEPEAWKHFIVELHQSRCDIFGHLVSKLHGCINQLEQFPIRGSRHRRYQL
jgi:E3 ubiquitin-protein ligase TRIP12